MFFNKKQPTPDLSKVEHNNFCFDVDYHPFWTDHFPNWEDETKSFYKRYCLPNRTVLDLGAWLGPCVFIALANNIKHVYAVEGDPANAYALNKNCHRNYVADKVTIINRCLHYKDQELFDFGNSLMTQDSSTRSFGGEVKVSSTTLIKLLDQYQIDLAELALIKVDIEGSELYLVDDLSKLASSLQMPIYFSMHPTFWPKFSDVDVAGALAILMNHYNFYTSLELPISPEQILNYLETNSNCSVILKSKSFDSKR